MLLLLDILLTALHCSIVLFITCGWLKPSWRKGHLIFITFVLFAWLVIGAWIGTIGYCPITDWHWDVKRALGETQLPASFIKYLVDKTLGINSDRFVIDLLTVGGLILGTALSVILLYVGKDKVSHAH